MTLDELFKEYKDYKTKIEGKSVESVEQYIYRLDSFIENNNLKTKEDLINLKVNDIKKWVSFLADNGNSERTRNAKLTAVKEVYNYLKIQDKEIIDEDILHIPFAKVPKREVKYVDSEDRDDLLAIITDSRVKTGMAVIFGTGVRFCELIQITCSDIERGYANVIGKGNKERTIWFDLWVQEIARKYINGKRKKIIEKWKVNTDLLLISNTGKPLTKQSFSRSMKTYAKKFNDNPLTEGRLDWWEHFSPHKIRHSFATEQLASGVDVATVRDEMGHSSIATTNNYSHSSQQRVRSAMLREKDKQISSELKEKQDLLKQIMENEELFNKVKNMIGGV